MRKVLHSILSAEPLFEVVGEARDGKEAVEKAALLSPDIITMDINMPVMDGLQATEQIMSANPKPIVIVSSESREGADITLKALGLGAIDFVAKPSSGIDLDMHSVRDELVRKLKVAAKVRVVRTAVRTKLGHEIANSAPRTEPSRSGSVVSSSSSSPAPMRSSSKFPIVAIAASTGGPATLMKLIPSFPSDFPAAGATHARELYHAICPAARGSMLHQGERGGARRNRLSRNRLYLPRISPPSRLRYRPLYPG